jgi:hypothetical protein
METWDPDLVAASLFYDDHDEAHNDVQVQEPQVPLSIFMGDDSLPPPPPPPPAEEILASVPIYFPFTLNEMRAPSPPPPPDAPPDEHGHADYMYADWDESDEASAAKRQKSSGGGSAGSRVGASSHIVDFGPLLQAALEQQCPAPHGITCANSGCDASLDFGAVRCNDCGGAWMCWSCDRKDHMGAVGVSSYTHFCSTLGTAR